MSSADVDRENPGELPQHRDRLAALGLLAAGVAHELNNALVPVVALSHHLAESQSGGDRNAIALIHQAGERARILVRSILSFAWSETARLEPVDLARVLRTVCPLLRSCLPDGLALRLDLRATPMVLTDEGLVCQMLLNLTDELTAVSADRNGEIAIALEGPSPDGPSAARLTVAMALDPNLPADDGNPDCAFGAAEAIAAELRAGFSAARPGSHHWRVSVTLPTATASVGDAE